MPSSATMKAAPMSRKVTQVTSHSPSHSSVGLVSSSGWPCSGSTGLGSAAPVHLVEGAPARRACRRAAPRSRRPVRPSPFRRRGRCGGRWDTRRARASPSTTSPSSTMPRSPGSALAGIGVVRNRSSTTRSPLGSSMRIGDRLAAAAAMRIADGRARR